MTNAESIFNELPMTLTLKPSFPRPAEGCKTAAMDGVDYPYVSKCRKKSRDLQQTLRLGVPDKPWNDHDICEGQFEDSSRFSDYSSCSDLCSSPESSTDGYHALRSSFNTLPNHHDLLSPFSPFVRHGQYHDRNTASDGASQRNTHARKESGVEAGVSFSLGDSDSPKANSFEVAYKRLIVDYPGGLGHDEQKYFHPIQEGYHTNYSGVKRVPVEDMESTLSLPDFLPKNEACPLNSTITSSGLRGNAPRVDVARSMTDLFSKHANNDVIRRYFVVGRVLSMTKVLNVILIGYVRNSRAPLNERVGVSSLDYPLTSTGALCVLTM